MRLPPFRVLLLLVPSLFAHPAAWAADGPCGFSPTDWYPAPPGDPCGRHRSEAACRADAHCAGLPYRGESVVACIDTGRGFSANCPAVGCISAAGQPAPVADPTARFLPAWQALQGREGGWSLLVSPAFPESWPPRKGSRGQAVVRYAFAYRPSVRIADGVEVGAPWARSVEAADSGVSVEMLRSRLEPLGIQGMRPMAGDEARLAGRTEEVAALLRTGPDPAREGLMRAFMCNWIGRQGVMAAEIAPHHPAFIRWLACP